MYATLYLNVMSIGDWILWSTLQHDLNFFLQVHKIPFGFTILFCELGATGLRVPIYYII